MLAMDMNEREDTRWISELIMDIMSKKLIKINAYSSAFEVAKMMSEYRVSSVILTDGQSRYSIKLIYCRSFYPSVTFLSVWRSTA